MVDGLTCIKIGICSCFCCPYLKVPVLFLFIYLIISDHLLVVRVQLKLPIYTTIEKGGFVPVEVIMFS